MNPLTPITGLTMQIHQPSQLFAAYLERQRLLEERAAATSAACPGGLEWYTPPGTLGGYWRCKSTGKTYPGGPFAYPRTLNGGATDMMSTNNGPPSDGWKEFVDSAQAFLAGIQKGGSYNVTFDPYLQDISVAPAAPPSQTINTWLLIGGGILLVLLLWR